jgi:DNA polymerase III sliding clamp (beta) subunit (PCNA family)
MDKIKRSTLESIVRVSKVCSKDKTRTQLAQVYIDIENKRIVAIDGYSLACQPLIDESFEKSFGIESRSIVLIKDLLKQNKSFRVFKVTSDEDEMRIHGESFIITIPFSKKEFPRYQTIIPNDEFRTSKDESFVEIAFNPDFLKNLAETLTEKPEKGIILRFKRDTLSPIIVKENSPEAICFGIIMPVNKC